MNIFEGKIFNNLTAIKALPYPKWLFKCVCGKTKAINKYDILSGRTKSCGCLTQEQRIRNTANRVVNSKFNKITIKSYSHKKNTKTYWNCECDCGNKFVAVLGNIINGSTKSCGCIRTQKYESGFSGLKRVFNEYKKSAKRKNIKFDLTINELKEITSKNCFYCGSAPERIAKAKTKKIQIVEYTTYKYNGIDRIDSNKGYEKSNIVPCCFWCNAFKRERSLEDFKKHICNIYHHLDK